jgi:hypothetical protein
MTRQHPGDEGPDGSEVREVELLDGDRAAGTPREDFGPRALAPSTGRRQARTTVAPCFASCSTVVKPIPEFAPVTM